MSVPMISVYLAEISPIKNRGRNFLYLCLCNPFGLTLMVVIAYFVLEDIDAGDWRILCFFTSGFSLISFIISIIFLYESPRFLIINGVPDEGMKVL